MPEHDLEIVTLERPRPANGPAFLSAQILPGRGMMTLQIRALLPRTGETDLLRSPSVERARELLDGSPDDFVGRRSYFFGGAVLLPYANRIRGRLSPDGRSIDTDILGRTVRLPANAGGRRPGAEQYALHGLVLDAAMDEVRRRTSNEEDAVVAFLQAGDFGGRWLSSTEITFEYVLRSDSFTLIIRARNVGEGRLPMGIGWHPYFNLPSGRRSAARLHVPARRRTLVNDYDEVLPTGEVEPVAGTPYDFSMPGGKPLGDLSLDDCFVDLQETAGMAAAELIDGEAAYGLRVTTSAPPVRAFQVYGPPAEGFIALEPQFNWADPFGKQWAPEADTGMALLEPGESVVYSARLELFVP